MSEWERKIVQSQGRQQPLASRSEVFAVDKFRGGDQGTGDFLWKAQAKRRVSYLHLLQNEWPYLLDVWVQFQESRARDARITQLQGEINQLRKKHSLR